MALVVGLTTMISLLPGAPLLAAETGMSIGSPEQLKDVSGLESKFFARQYNNDPLEKRIERLELMIFAATQDGQVNERLSRIKKAVVSHSNKPAAALAPGHSATPSPGAPRPGSKPETAATYPVLNTLEWRALKKTYPQEGLPVRLGRLEKKVFGVENSTISYFDRVERLKRTLGVGVTAQAQPGTPMMQMPLGPMPKARPRSQSQDYFGFNPPGLDDSVVIPGMPGMPGVPGFSGFPNANPQMPDAFHHLNSFNQAFGQMMRDMNRQMQEMSRLGPGTWIFDQETGTWVEQGTGKRVKPGSPPSALTPRAGKPNALIPPNAAPPVPSSPPQIAPFLEQPKSHEIPPYADPNSI